MECSQPLVVLTRMAVVTRAWFQPSPAASIYTFYMEKKEKKSGEGPGGEPNEHIDSGKDAHALTPHTLPLPRPSPSPRTPIPPPRNAKSGARSTDAGRRAAVRGAHRVSPGNHGGSMSRCRGGKNLCTQAPRGSREVILVGRPYKCPYCKSQRTVSKGTRPTKGLGPRRLRRCKACGRKFTPKYQRPGNAAAKPDQAGGTARPSAQKEVAPHRAADADVNVVL